MKWINIRLEKEISNKSTLVNTLNTEKKTLTTNISELKEKITNLNTRNKESATITVRQQKEISELEKNISNLESKNSKIKKDLKDQKNYLLKS